MSCAVSSRGPLTSSSPESADDVLVRECLRVYRRYAREIVEAHNLCPWAERARKDGAVAEEVLLGEGEDLEPALDCISTLVNREEIEIGLLIFPRVRSPRHEWEPFVARVRAAHEAQYDVGRAPFAMAAFHPEARPNLETPERLIPFIRRSPDPLIQLVRQTALDRVKGSVPEGTSFVDLATVDLTQLKADTAIPVRERVARQNLKTVERVSVEELEACLDDIRRERNEAYARIGF